MNRKVQGLNFTLFDVLAGDIINGIFAYLPIVLTYYFTYKVISFVSQSIPILLIVILAPLFMILLLILIIFFIRITLPKLREGIFLVGFNRDYIAWQMHMNLGRSIKISGLSTLINSFNFFKVLSYKALGMKISWRFISSLYTQVVDYSLVEIDEGTILTDEVQLSAHTMIRNKLWLKKIKIGKNVYVGTKSFIGLGTTINNNCIIGSHNKTFNDVIAEGTQLAPFVWEHGKPRGEGDKS